MPGAGAASGDDKSGRSNTVSSGEWLMCFLDFQPKSSISSQVPIAVWHVYTPHHI